MINACATATTDVDNFLHVACEEKSKGKLVADTHKLRITTTLFDAYLDRVMDKAGPKVDSIISKEDQKELEKTDYYLKLAYFRDVRTSILKSARTTKCPYCYNLKATEVDHYLPKSKFGEYAVYSPNLVPICKTCNGKKLSKYMRHGGGRRFLHPYYDKLPALPVHYLAATVTVNHSVLIAFKLVRTAEMSDEIWTIFSHQFTELDLASRYTDDAVEMINTMLLSLRDHFRTGGRAHVAKQILIEQASKERVYGLNHWWPVTLGALAASNKFCDGGFNILDPEGIVLLDSES